MAIEFEQQVVTSKGGGVCRRALESKTDSWLGDYEQGIADFLAKITEFAPLFVGAIGDIKVEPSGGQLENLLLRIQTISPLSLLPIRLNESKLAIE